MTCLLLTLFKNNNESNNRHILNIVLKCIREQYRVNASHAFIIR